MRVKTTLLLLLALCCSIVASAQCSGATFQEQNGIVVIQAENVSTTGSWAKQSSQGGFTGSGYLNWTGSEFFGTPGNGLIQYTVRINSPGTYRFNWRTKIGIGNNSTEHNDTWLRIPGAADFYAQKGNSRIYPRGTGKTPNPEGASSDGWFKVYMNSLQWTWSAFTSDFDGHVIYVRFATAGVYTIQLSARSRGHLIDRMVLYKESQYGAGSAQDLSRAETLCDGNPTPPPSGGGGGGGDTGGGGGGTANTPPTVNITSPSNGATIAPGSNVSITLNSNDTDGNVVQHRILVNGSIVDTDGAGYTPYVINNITSGNYTVRASVTDDDGAVTNDDISFTVSGGSGGGGGDTGGDTGGGSGGGTGNAAPTESITSPTNGANVAVGSNVSVNLNANDSDGSVVEHKIFVNGTLVDTDGAGFTPHIITGIAAGNYTVRAMVTDNDGATSEDSISFTAGGGSGGGGDTGGGDTGGGGNSSDPTVSITSPTNGANVAVGSDVFVRLSANDADGSVVEHKIFVNGRLVDTDGANFTPHIITGVTAGSYTVRALVTDNDGNTGETTISFTAGGATGGGGSNGDPTVSITSPANGANFAAGSDVFVRLSANDADGSLVEYKIFVNGRLVDTDGANFTPHIIVGVTAGSYTVRALVTDNDGNTGEATSSFTVSGSGRELTDVKAVAYPNPTPDGTLSVKFPRVMGAQIGYNLMSPAGQLIDSGVIENSTESDAAELKLPALQNSQEGIYYLIVTDGAQSYTIPVIRK